MASRVICSTYSSITRSCSVIGADRIVASSSASTNASSSVTRRRNSACESSQYWHRFVAETTVVIISCCRRVSGRSGDISAPKAANAWYSASGISECEPTIPSVSS